MSGLSKRRYWRLANTQQGLRVVPNNPAFRRNSRGSACSIPPGVFFMAKCLWETHSTGMGSQICDRNSQGRQLKIPTRLDIAAKKCVVQPQTLSQFEHDFIIGTGFAQGSYHALTQLNMLDCVLSYLKPALKRLALPRGVGGKNNVCILRCGVHVHVYVNMKFQGSQCS